MSPEGSSSPQARAADPRAETVLRPPADPALVAAARAVAGNFARADADADAPLRAAQRRFADALRAVTEVAAGVTPDLDRLRAATDLAERLADTLGPGERTRRYGGAEVGLGGPGPDFLDWSPICGPSNPTAPPLRLSIDAERASVTGRASFGAAYEGPPGCVHGGWIAASFDEVLGVTQSVFADPGMTVRLDVRYLAPTPLHRPVVFEGWVVEVQGRRRTLAGHLLVDGVATARVEGTFVSVSLERFLALVEARDRPED